MWFKFLLGLIPLFLTLFLTARSILFYFTSGIHAAPVDWLYKNYIIKFVVNFYSDIILIVYVNIKL